MDKSFLTQKILGVIPARGGSKGIPNKNMQIVGGLPLVARAIQCARECSFIDKLLVSTDSPAIADIAKKYGADVPFLRPTELAGDTSPMLPVLKHALEQAEIFYQETFNAVILLDATGPLKTPVDISQAYELFSQNDCDAVISGSEAHRNPYFNMVKERGKYVEIVLNSEKTIARRQDCPPIYDLNTLVWIYSRSAILNQERIPLKTKLFLVPAEKSIDIDNEHDLINLRKTLDAQ